MRPEELDVETVFTSDMPQPAMTIFLILFFGAGVLAVVGSLMKKNRKSAIVSWVVGSMLLVSIALAAWMLLQSVITGYDSAEQKRIAIVTTWVESHGLDISEKTAEEIALQIMFPDEHDLVTFNTDLEGTPVSIQVIQMEDGSFSLFHTQLDEVAGLPLGNARK